MGELKKFLRSSESIRYGIADLINRELNNLNARCGNFNNPMLKDLSEFSVSDYRLKHYREIMSVSNAMRRLTFDKPLNSFIKFLYDNNKFKQIDELEEMILNLIVNGVRPSMFDMEDLMQEVRYTDSNLKTINERLITISYVNSTQTQVPSLIKKLINKGYLRWKLFDFPNSCDAKYIKNLEDTYNEFVKCIDVALSDDGLISNFNLDMEHDYQVDSRYNYEHNFLVVVNHSLDELGDFNKILRGKKIILYKTSNGELKANDKSLLT